MKNRTIVQPFFLTKVDEDIFSNQLEKEFNSIKFVDNNRWSTPIPILKKSIGECSSNYVFLWPSNIVESLPIVPIGDQFDGPQSGIVMQFMRSRIHGDTLFSGQLGVGFSDKNVWMADWSKSVFNVLRKLNVTKLKSIGVNSSVTGAYVVGGDAARLLKEGGIFQHNSANVSYELATIKNSQNTHLNQANK